MPEAKAIFEFGKVEAGEVVQTPSDFLITADCLYCCNVLVEVLKALLR